MLLEASGLSEVVDAAVEVEGVEEAEAVGDVGEAEGSRFEKSIQ